MEKELQKNNWDFTLYDVDGKKIISVVFYNSYVDVSRSFLLNKEEENYNFEELKKLSERIRKNYDFFKCREVTPSL
ncbi:MAG: hypothetical protein Q4G16_07835 [Cruoricaptor ignavus]|nr:hypothetical protein [Cruoricaptor ignavus]